MQGRSRVNPSHYTHFSQRSRLSTKHFETGCRAQPNKICCATHPTVLLGWPPTMSPTHRVLTLPMHQKRRSREEGARAVSSDVRCHRKIFITILLALCLGPPAPHSASLCRSKLKPWEQLPMPTPQQLSRTLSCRFPTPWLRRG